MISSRLRALLKSLFIILCLCLFLFPSDCKKGMTMTIADFLPDDMHGWKKSGADRTYDRETIFDYIDGGGEVYLTYGFRKVIVRSYTRSEEPEILAEIFDMGSSFDAFGMLSFEREGDHVDVGEDSEYQPGALRFWKGKYFIIVSSERRTPDTEKAVMSLGREISKRLKETGEKPRMLRYLPQRGLIKNQIRFFHAWFNLNYHFFVAEKNILNLDERTDAVLAPYLIQDARSFLLLISYESESKAQDAYRTFLHAYMLEATETGIIMTENKKWTLAKRSKNLVIVIFDSPSKEEALKFLESVQQSVVLK